jgi:hypothetical protein
VGSAISPAGEIYFYGRADEYLFPLPTATFGNPPSQEVGYISKLDKTGKALHKIALRGLWEGYFLRFRGFEGFYATPGAYRSTPTVTNTGFICKQRASDGDAIFG